MLPGGIFWREPLSASDNFILWGLRCSFFVWRGCECDGITFREMREGWEVIIEERVVKGLIIYLPRWVLESSVSSNVSSRLRELTGRFQYECDT